MSRSARTFQSVFDDLADALNLTPAGVLADADLQRRLLAVFNRAYTRGYNKWLWEDAWTGAAETPVSRVIAFGDIADSRRFEVWSADPRDPTNAAYEVRSITGGSGITLMEDLSTVFVLSMPKAPKFTTTAYAAGTTYAAGARVLDTDGHVYVSLQAGNVGHTPASSTAYWQVEPVLEVLAEFTVAYARGTYLIENGQPQTGAAARSDALNELEAAAMSESVRASTAAWRPRCC